MVGILLVNTAETLNLYSINVCCCSSKNGNTANSSTNLNKNAKLKSQRLSINLTGSRKGIIINDNFF